MVGRFLRSAGLIALAAGVLACSKTQDTAPERRIFGNPPVIESVDVTSFPSQPVTCDWTAVLLNTMVCSFGFDPSTLPTPFPTITVNLTYNEVHFQIRASDPDPPPPSEKTDILLVTGSFLTNLSGSKPQEQSLIILDDGGSNQFDFQQKMNFDGAEEDCAMSPSSCKYCTTKTYKLTSNDASADDGLYTRGFGFMSNSAGLIPSGDRANALYQDCLVSQRKQAPEETSKIGSQTVSFKIEAIDRAGNIATWPVQPQVSLQPNSLTCTGDICGCCIFTSQNVLAPPSPNHPQQIAGCYDLPGLVGQPGSDYDCGLCSWIHIQQDNSDQNGGTSCGTCRNHKSGCPCFTDGECSGTSCVLPPFGGQGSCAP